MLSLTPLDQHWKRRFPDWLVKVESVSAASLCNAATFISDVTIPDGSILNLGAAFVKTWRLKNSGTCTWTSAYAAVFDSGAQLGGTTSVPMPASVAPDHILVMKDGRIAAEGSLEQLLVSSQEMRDIWQQEESRTPNG